MPILGAIQYMLSIPYEPYEYLYTWWAEQGRVDQWPQVRGKTVAEKCQNAAPGYSSVSRFSRTRPLSNSAYTHASKWDGEKILCNKEIV